jgi:uncharacterized protein YjbI with pentapeptide repeats
MAGIPQRSTARLTLFDRVSPIGLKYPMNHEQTKSAIDRYTQSSQQIFETLSEGQSGSGADLYQVNLSGKVLSKVDLRHATLIRADLTQTDLAGANLAGADLRGASLDRAILKDANLTGACLARVDLSGADLSGADLTDAKMQGVRYDRHTIFPDNFNYKSSGAIGPGARLNGAQLNTANLRYFDLQDANLLGAYLGGADLTGANLQGVRLSQADMRRAFLTGACLRNAGLNGANLAGADLRAADLTDVEFDLLESIAGADFSHAQGLTDEIRSRLLSYPATELETYNSFTRNTTGASLGVRL